MGIKLIYVPNDDKQNLPLNCKLKKLDTTRLESNNQNSIKVPNKTFGTNAINSPMSHPSLVFYSITNMARRFVSNAQEDLF